MSQWQRVWPCVVVSVVLTGGCTFVERVNVGANGATTNEQAGPADVSRDGRYVEFASNADLTVGDHNAVGDVFVRDLVTGGLSLVSVASNGAAGDRASHGGSMDASGRWVAFSSFADNLAAGDTNGIQDDVFVRDRQLGLTIRASVGLPGTFGQQGSDIAFISPDGRYVTFSATSNDILAQQGSFIIYDSQVFRFDRVNHTTTQVSVSTTGGQPDDASFPWSISDNGRFVAFASDATDLVSGDTNGQGDVFVRDMQMQTTTRVSVTNTGHQSTGGSDGGHLSDDGRYVAFDSNGSDLVATSPSGGEHVYIRDLQLHTTIQADVTPAGISSNDSSFSRDITGDGRYLMIDSYATDLVPPVPNSSPSEHVYIRDLVTGHNWRVDLDALGRSPSDAKNLDFTTGYALTDQAAGAVFVTNAPHVVGGPVSGNVDVYYRGAKPVAVS